MTLAKLHLCIQISNVNTIVAATRHLKIILQTSSRVSAPKPTNLETLISHPFDESLLPRPLGFGLSERDV